MLKQFSNRLVKKNFRQDFGKSKGKKLTIKIGMENGY